MNEKELYLIALMLDEDIAPRIIDRVTCSMFTVNHYGTAYSIARELHQHAGRVDMVKLLELYPETEEHKQIFKSELIQAIQNSPLLNAYRNDIDSIITSIVDSKIKTDIINAALNSATSSDLIDTVNRIYNDNAVKLDISKDFNNSEYLSGLFKHELTEFQSNKEIKTGFKDFDDMTGGLYAGLYCIGAISSLGKTTLAYQIADHIAKSGRNVFYFSLEMSRLELVTKSISRIAAMNSKTGNTPTSMEIRKKGILTQEIKQAYEEYQKTAHNMTIFQGDFGTGVDTIREKLKKFRRENPASPSPVVFVDYLQILKPAEHVQGNTKAEIDYNVSELKRISRDYCTPVIVISSFNRTNYENIVSFESFNGSGGIEYTADVVIGLQLGITSALKQGQGYTNINREFVELAKNESPRIIELKILKSRYSQNYKFGFMYDTKHDLFIQKTIKAHEELQPLIKEYNQRIKKGKESNTDKGETKKKAGTSNNDSFFE